MFKLFVKLLTVVFLVTPALAQERRSPNPPRQQPRPQVSRQQPSRPQLQVSRPAVRQAPRVVVQPRAIVTRPYYRSYYRSYGRYYGGYGYGGYGYSGYGYGGYGYGYGRSFLTGLKFQLELVPKNERKMVEQGIVSVDGAEVGIVNRHDGFWNGAIPVSSGDHEVVVEHPDGRVFRTQVFVQQGQILHIYLRFQKP